MANVSTIVIISCHKPVITEMELFAIIVNSFWPFAIVAKSSILNVVGFLDPPLHCNKFAAKVSWFKHKRIIIYTCISLKVFGKIFDYIRETYFG